jgi:hypothetical protein
VLVLGGFVVLLGILYALFKDDFNGTGPYNTIASGEAIECPDGEDCDCGLNPSAGERLSQ